MKINELRSFVPCKDFEESKAFYSALGFEVKDASSELSICTKDATTFFLQNYYDQNFAENLMMQLIVSNIDDALETISAIEIFEVRHSPIKQENWGKVIYLWGPAGELWHITELAD